MSLTMIDKASTYKNYLKAKNSSQGICLGISVEWILGIMSNKSAMFNVPEPYSGKGLARQNSYLNFNNTSHVGTSRTREAFYIERKLQNELGLPVKIKKVNEYLFSKVCRNNHVKRYLLTIPHRKGFNVAATMTWHFPNGTGHAVAIFKDKVNEKIYFYDPNDGVYEWEETDLDLYYEIKEHIKLKHKSLTMLGSVVLVETEKYLSFNYTYGKGKSFCS